MLSSPVILMAAYGALLCYATLSRQKPNETEAQAKWRKHATTLCAQLVVALGSWQAWQELDRPTKDRIQQGLTLLLIPLSAPAAVRVGRLLMPTPIRQKPRAAAHPALNRQAGASTTPGRVTTSQAELYQHLTYVVSVHGLLEATGSHVAPRYQVAYAALFPYPLPYDEASARDKLKSLHFSLRQQELLIAWRRDNPASLITLLLCTTQGLPEPTSWKLTENISRWAHTAGVPECPSS